MACGTVFNELLLWKLSISCSFEKQAVVQKRIAGHDGVIFSVRYSIERSLLCSVSDDRSIKVRKVVFSNDFADVQVSLFYLVENLLTVTLFDMRKVGSSF